MSKCKVSGRTGLSVLEASGRWLTRNPPQRPPSRSASHMHSFAPAFDGAGLKAINTRRLTFIYFIFQLQ